MNGNKSLIIWFTLITGSSIPNLDHKLEKQLLKNYFANLFLDNVNLRLFMSQIVI